MEFKIDTKEKFYVITPDFKEMTAIMADKLVEKLQILSENEPFNIILNLSEVVYLEDKAAEKLAALRSEIYSKEHSIVVCCMKKPVLELVEALELEEAINCTPTESEAWDIVQMDEIEREFLNEGDA